MEPSDDVVRQQLHVAVGTELCGKMARVRMEVHESSNNSMRMEALKPDNPVVMGSAIIDQNESKPVSQATQTITEGNVEVDPIQILGGEREGSTAWIFGQCREFTKAGSGVAALNEL